MPDQPSDVYRNQLASQGVALWRPGPPRDVKDNVIYNNVSIGDVGFLHDGAFMRMFNVMLPWDDPSNQTFGILDPYRTLSSGPFVNIVRDDLGPQTYRSGKFSEEGNADYIYARTRGE